MTCAKPNPDSYLKLHRSTSEHVVAAKLGAVAARVLEFLRCRFYDNEQTTFVKFTNEQICKACDFGLRSIQNALRELERAKIVTVEYERTGRRISPGVAFWAKREKARLDEVAHCPGQQVFEFAEPEARPKTVLTPLPRPTPAVEEPMRQAAGAEYVAPIVPIVAPAVVAPVAIVQQVKPAMQPQQRCGVGSSFAQLADGILGEMRGGYQQSEPQREFALMASEDAPAYGGGETSASDAVMVQAQQIWDSERKRSLKPTGGGNRSDVRALAGLLRVHGADVLQRAVRLFIDSPMQHKALAVFIRPNVSADFVDKAKSRPAVRQAYDPAEASAVMLVQQELARKAWLITDDEVRQWVRRLGTERIYQAIKRCGTVVELRRTLGAPPR